jgi:hypothetical protein
MMQLILGLDSLISLFFASGKGTPILAYFDDTIVRFCRIYSKLSLSKAVIHNSDKLIL